VRRTTRTTLTLAAMASAVIAALASASAASASAASYPPPSIHLGCTAAPTNGTLEGSVCALPSGVTTAPNSYSETIAVTKRGAAGPTVTFALTAGSLPPGLSMSPSGSAAAITGNPTKTGTFSFTIKATDANLTATQAYRITITLQGPPDQLLCDPADNKSFLESGTCVLPDAVVGQPYAGNLLTSHKAGGALSVVSGSLPPGLSLPATFTGSGDTIGGAPAQPGVEPTYTFTVQGTGDQGQPLYQVFSITVDPNQPLAIVLPSSGSTLFPGNVGQALALNFFLSGGAAPFTWAVIAGHLPTGMQLQTFSDPRDANDEMAGTPTTAGTFTWTMRVTDYLGQQATQQFTITIQS
jgi:large repetitive protein